MISRYFAVVAVCTLAIGTALAQTTPPVSPGTNTAAAPVAGANSFTEGEARTRIESRGFTNVAGLKKDDQGIWRGTAMKDGKPVTVALDFKGNVFAE